MSTSLNSLVPAIARALLLTLRPALLRMRTLLTAILAMLGLLPMALSHGIGSETQTAAGRGDHRRVDQRHAARARRSARTVSRVVARRRPLAYRIHPLIMPSTPYSRVATLVIVAMLMTACVAGHNPLAAWQRPLEISREWVDVEKSTPADTTLWVLGPDGYDGIAHLRISSDAAGVAHQSRTEHRYGSWYLDGTMGDSTHQAICFSRRLGRFGATCVAFVLDTIMRGSVPTPRLFLPAYRGSQHTRDRQLEARSAAVRP